MPKKVPFERDEVIAAALGIVDEGTIADLTIRSLAARLDVNPMTVYRFVPSKEDLLIAVAEAVLHDPGAAPLRVPLSDWRTALTAWADALIGRLSAHRSALPLFAGAAGRGQLSLAARLPVVVLRAAGMTTADAVATAQGLVALVLGAAQLDPEADDGGITAPLARTAEFWDVAVDAPRGAQLALGFDVDADGDTLALVEPADPGGTGGSVGDARSPGTAPAELSFFAHNLHLALDGVAATLSKA